MGTCSFQPVENYRLSSEIFHGEETRNGFDRPLPVTFLDSLGKENDEIVNKKPCIHAYTLYIYIYYCYYINVFCASLEYDYLFFNFILSLFQARLRRELQRNYIYINYTWIINDIKIYLKTFEKFFCDIYIWKSTLLEYWFAISR